MLKQLHPEWGCQRISDELLRGPALAASVAAVARVLHEAGYQMEERHTRPHPDQPRCFERARPNQLWQTDLFTFVLKRQNRRLYLVGFMGDYSRFVVIVKEHGKVSPRLAEPDPTQRKLLHIAWHTSGRAASLQTGVRKVSSYMSWYERLRQLGEGPGLRRPGS
jgi:transposase InsO family protein